VKFTVEMSVRRHAAEPDAIAAVARAAERAGVDMIGFTDHPAPSKKWLSTGGHPSFDPFAALAFVAAVTERVRLMTYLAVLPYRNPMLLAKSVATVDRLSGGRFTLVAGTGYLRSEFSALGRELDDRNERFDEAIEVLRHVFVDDDFRFEGSDFTTRGVAQDPLPVQLPHPPIWIGGSSRASRQRAARIGDGWAPLLTSEAFARTVRTATLPTLDDLAHAIRDLRELVVAEGRDPDRMAVQFDGLGVVGGTDAAAVRERVDELERIGVTHAVLRPPNEPTDVVVEAFERFGAEVISPSA
jgi:probable F420-dependent oxidoreductase